MITRRIIAPLLALFCVSAGTAQVSLSGRLVNNTNESPAAFVTVATLDQKYATLTDVEGTFTIQVARIPVSLVFHSLEYETDTLLVTTTNPIIHRLLPKSHQLQEVEVLPGVNPAHRIINNATANARTNDPERNFRYRAVSYNRFSFNLEFSENQRKSMAADSGGRKTLEWIDSNHIFLMESVTERIHLPPDRTRENVLANRVSGLENPMFSLFATQMQSFSFYQPQLTVLGTNYLNPISSGSTSRYLFILQDTVFDTSGDTTFVISYRPLKGSNFNGLQGILFIESRDFAITNVIAEPWTANSALSIRIEQQYVRHKTHWRPDQLLTWLTSTGVVVEGGGLIGYGSTFIREFDTDTTLKPRDIGDVAVQLDDQANHRDSLFWNQHRNRALNTKELRSYALLDSIGKEANLDKLSMALEILAAGKIPLWIFNIDIDRIIDYNDYEGLRLGLGIHTNHKLSKWVTTGGYFAYGFKDKAWKFGGDIDVLFHRRSDTRLNLEAWQDVPESGGVGFTGDKGSWLSDDRLRNVFVSRRDRVQQYQAQLQFRALRHFRTTIFARNREINFWNPYLFKQEPVSEAEILRQGITVSECGAVLRFGFRERFVETPLRRYSLGTRYPIIMLQYTRGVPLVFGELEFSRIDLRATWSYRWKVAGATGMFVQAGIVDQSVPYALQFNAWGSFRQWNVSAPTTFETMRPNEFLSDRYVMILLDHRFGTSLFGNKKFVPQPRLFLKALFGQNQHTAQHQGIDVKSPEHGYYEAGISLDNFIRSGLSGVGIGFHYRFGPYSFSRFQDNAAIKFSFTTSLQ
jgi:hypothetical protein